MIQIGYEHDVIYKVRWQSGGMQIVKNHHGIPFELSITICQLAMASRERERDIAGLVTATYAVTQILGYQPRGKVTGVIGQVRVKMKVLQGIGDGNEME